MMARLGLTLPCLAAAVAVAVLAMASGAASQAPGPAPAADCTAAVTSLAACLPYVQQGSTQGKPSKECCAGVKVGVKSPATVACLCSAFTQYASQVNLTRAAALPAECGEDPKALSKCNIQVPGAPGSAPGSAPAAPSPGSSKSAASTGSPVSAYAVLAATLFSYYYLL